jgi:alkanesulfonate monooxygenase SsuD/methylene tetrahydromethanopterin reductase-like flavin-dependent oxidoreductase (luciferase family)
MKLTLGALPDADGLPGLMSSVQAAADGGFPRVWVPQLPPSGEFPKWDALTALALAGARTPGIELGTAVVVAQTQHPLALARQALTVSAATQGRLILGVGVSHEAVITGMFGLSYDAPGQPSSQQSRWAILPPSPAPSMCSRHSESRGQSHEGSGMRAAA